MQNSKLQSILLERPHLNLENETQSKLIQTEAYPTYKHN